MGAWHLSRFVSGKIADGRLEWATDANGPGVRLPEHDEARLEALRDAIREGVDSGLSERLPEDVRKRVKKRLRKSGRLQGE